MGTWKGRSVTKRSGVYGATIAEADTTAILEMNENGQLVQVLHKCLLSFLLPLLLISS